MTRKQAVLQAIEILSKDKDNYELCEVLHSIFEDLPMSHWSDKAIFDAFDQYILDNCRLPSRNEIINNPKLPTHSTVKNRFGITLQEFYKKYYSQYIKKCPSRVYHYQSTEYWIENFKEQYIKNDYPTQKNYDLLREKDTPSSRHIIKLSSSKNWNELLYNCGFEVHGQNINSTILIQRNKTKFTVTPIRNIDVNEEQIKEINTHLQSIISGNN
jgi:hypothetical protein